MINDRMHLPTGFLRRRFRHPTRLPECSFGRGDTCIRMHFFSGFHDGHGNRMRGCATRHSCLVSLDLVSQISASKDRKLDISFWTVRARKLSMKNILVIRISKIFLQSHLCRGKTKIISKILKCKF